LLDVPWLKRLGKKIFFYFCGCDVRDCKATIAKYEISACAECWPQLCSSNRRQALDAAARYADGNFVSTPDLLEFVPGSRLMPQPIDLDAFTRLRSEVLPKATSSGQHEASAASAPLNKEPTLFPAQGTPKPETKPDRVVIAHAPSNRAIKGTKYVEAAVAQLQEWGYPVQLLLIEKLPHAEALRRCAAADLIVDQLLVGAYGEFAVEMMALGKPVVCYLRPDLLKHYPSGLPIVSATPRTLPDVLVDLLRRREQWPDLGQRGMRYVERAHDSYVVAKAMLQHYREGKHQCAS